MVISQPQNEQFEDTKGVTKIRKSKDRKYNDQKTKDKRQAMVQNTFRRKHNIELP